MIEFYVIEPFDRSFVQDDDTFKMVCTICSSLVETELEDKCLMKFITHAKKLDSLDNSLVVQYLRNI